MKIIIMQLGLITELIEGFKTQLGLPDSARGGSIVGGLESSVIGYNPGQLFLSFFWKKVFSWV